MDIEAIRARADKATPGPWHIEDYGYMWNNAGRVICKVYDNQRRNADFIAHAREDIPDLLAEVERLHNLLAERNVLLDKQDIELATVKAERDKAVEDFADFLVENESSIRLAYDTQDRNYLEATIKQWRESALAKLEGEK